MILDAFQRDAVTEVLNIAIGHAASALNEMVEDEVGLSVPFIDFMAREQAVARLQQDSGPGTLAIAVKQQFEGPFGGDALLIFPEHKSLDLVRSIMGEHVPLQSLTELEQEALMEVGNVLLNASLGSMANQLGSRIETSLPVYLRGDGSAILETGADALNRDDVVMFLHVDFELKRRDIHGYVAFVMDVDSANSFRDLVDASVARALATIH